MTISIIILIVLVIILLWAVLAYNGLRPSRAIAAQEAWADIDVQLKRRYDLIPNLVNTVKGYAAHESSRASRTSPRRAPPPWARPALPTRVRQKMSWPAP